MENIVREEEQDHFDCLPDAILLEIFNKVLEAKSLTRCLVVCKRFLFLVPQVNNLVLPIIPRCKSSKRSVLKIIFKKLKCFFITPKSSSISSSSSAAAAANKDSSTLWCPVLNNNNNKKFGEIKFMNVQFPVDDVDNGGGDGDGFIKWKGDFGRELESCIILGATSFYRKEESSYRVRELGGEGQFLTDDQLKLRIVWMISCLISSSARHHFLKQIVSKNSQLQRVVASDSKDQGKLFMDEKQLVEMRKSMDYDDSSSLRERTALPDLNIKMLYLPLLELPASGYVMRGATLVVIRAIADADAATDDDDSVAGDLLRGWFDGEGEVVKKKAFGEAVRELMKVKKSYLMTMNSF